MNMPSMCLCKTLGVYTSEKINPMRAGVITKSDEGDRYDTRKPANMAYAFYS